MEPLPFLVEKPEQAPETITQVLMEEFSDVLTKPVLPKNIQSNINKYNVMNTVLRDSNYNIEKIYNLTKIATEDINDVEYKIITNHAFNIVQKDYIENDPVLKEKIKLQVNEVTPDLPLDVVNKYSLIVKKQFEEHPAKKNLDFRFNNKIRCYPPEEKSEPKKCLREDKLPSSNEIDLFLETYFAVSPHRVIFSNYKINRTYKKSIKLTNITNKKRGIYIKEKPNYKCFELVQERSNFGYAPGMSAIITVIFKTDTFLDVHDKVVFSTYTGSDIEVELACFRIAPCLRTFVFKGMQDFEKKGVLSCGSMFYDASRSIALNSVIDCGTCLMGMRKNLSLIMQNEGSEGLFFIITEKEWFDSNVANVSQDLILSMEDFKIQPTYFKSEPMKFVEIEIEFFPSTPGLQIEHIYMLCDNITFERLDLIGDGLCFSIDMISIKALPLTKGFSNCDEESNQYLYVGAFLPWQKQTHQIIVENKSCIEFKFHWEVRRSHTRKPTLLKNLQPEWLQIESSGVLPPLKESEFNFSLECQTAETGLHSLVVMFIAEDIPEIALDEEYTFEVYEKPYQSDGTNVKLVDVIVSQMEMSLDIFPYCVEVQPKVYTNSSVLGYKRTLKDTFHVLTYGTANIFCKWVIPEDAQNFIEVSPTEFILEPCVPMICTVLISAINYDDIYKIINFEVENGALVKNIVIDVLVEKPSVVFSTHNIYGGILPKGKNKDIQISVVSKCYEPIDWAILEIFYDQDKNKFFEVKCRCHMNAVTGQLLDYGEERALTYTLNTLRDVNWCSFLILLASHPALTSMSSVCLVSYTVMTPHVKIQTISSEFPILCPDELLFRNITMHKKVLLQNHSNVTACFLWGKPCGDGASSMNIKFIPKSGILRPCKGAYIDVYLTPTMLGIFEDIYVPCFIGRLNMPLMLRILCAVEDVYVNIYLPKKGGDFEVILWPPQMINDFDLNQEMDVMLEHEGYEDDLTRCYCEDIMHYTCFCKHEDIEGIVVKKPPETFSIAVEKYLKQTAVRKDGCEDEGPHDYYSLLSFSSEKSESYCSYCPDNLNNYISNNINYLDQVVECFKVPLRTPVKRTIYIENLTPTTGVVTVESSNFYGIDISIKQKVMGAVLYDLKVRRTSDWEDIMNNDGVLVRAIPNVTNIIAFQKVQIDIWVYATTWGVYLDEISIDINQIMPFCFNLLIEVVGCPIEFPFALNSILTQPTFRFGTLSYKTGKATRELKIANVTEIPLRVMWHLFVYKGCEQGDSAHYFNVLFDLLKSSEWSNLNYPSLDGKVILTREYYGKTNSKIFQLNEFETFLEKKEATYMKITCDSDYFKPDIDNTLVEAYLIGFVYLSDCHRYQPETLRRPTGNEIEPVKLKIVANIELPVLKLDYTVEDMRIEIDSYTIYKQEYFATTKKICFANSNYCNAVINMSIEAPFEVERIKTEDTCDDEFNVLMEVKENENLEVSINCSITFHKVLELSNLLYSGDECFNYGKPDFTRHSVIVERNLNIKQKGILQQTIPMELIVYYPLFTVTPGTIDFGMTFVSSSTKAILTLTNKTAHEIPFITCTKPRVENILVCSPNSGVIPGYGFSDIHVYFIPDEVTSYQETLRINSYLSTYFCDVPLQGMGTSNEKFYYQQ